MGGEAAGNHDGGGGQAWSGMRAAAGVGTVSDRTVEFVEPTEKSLVAWDHKLLGFGVRAQPSGTKSFWLNVRTCRLTVPRADGTGPLLTSELS